MESFLQNQFNSLMPAIAASRSRVMGGRPEEIKSPRSTVIGKIRIVITLISCVSVWDPWLLVGLQVFHTTSAFLPT
jgi:hypothetical protein